MRQENAANRYENVELVAKRQGKLEDDEGGFRTVAEGRRVRARGHAELASDVRPVEKVFGGTVCDTQGEKHDTRRVLFVLAG